MTNHIDIYKNSGTYAADGSSEVIILYQNVSCFLFDYKNKISKKDSDVTYLQCKLILDGKYSLVNIDSLFYDKEAKIWYKASSLNPNKLLSGIANFDITLKQTVNAEITNRNDGE